MGRKKKEAAEVIETSPGNGATATADPGQQDEILQKHASLKERVRTLKAKRGFFQNETGQEIKQQITREYDEKIKTTVLSLEHIDKKDLEKTQGEIAGMRWARQVVQGLAWDAELERAEARLAEFEEENALFLGSGREPLEVPEGASRLTVEVKRLDDKKDADLIKILKENGFSYSGSSPETITDFWYASPDEPKAVELTGYITADPRVVECRAE